jgi:muramidase (phage lysozyme)
MILNRYQWAAVAAALILPTLLFARTKSSGKNNTALKNLKAFLLMIQYAEGTIGTNAYRMLYGGGLFSDYSNHPNIAITKWGITSTAAGAYQFLFSTWMEIQAALQLPDFSPISQDKAAVELIRKKDALADVVNGKIVSAIYKCRKIWASFPGAGYGQGEKNIESLLQFYIKAGGRLVNE